MRRVGVSYVLCGVVSLPRLSFLLCQHVLASAFGLFSSLPDDNSVWTFICLAFFLFARSLALLVGRLHFHHTPIALRSVRPW